ncbi:N-ethylmaleimide reductase [Pirellulimonas nuda]|uniref:N-ethylmaleimide reductase n=1 Tax=Pirellulimonas nuda TaxID=2528009 RepID=A0A518D861_9BACT|nr:alkene reductase [Pirellulimonas nuda]QDU87667.1 N-ethylmaleimide reductase [Pirellulimonas nuda]
MQSPHLLSKFDLSGLALRNRVVMAPMTRARAGESRLPNELMREYYTQRAGAGLIISEGVSISPRARGWVQSPGIYTDAMTAGWAPIVRAVHDAGAPFFLQLWHCGRASHSAFFEEGRAVAPSAIPIEEEYIHTPQGKQPHETPRALETAEIASVVEEYRAAAERAQQAGFDGVEIHGANGYLIDSFLQSKTNHRTDAYGGSIENRCRFLFELAEAVCSVFPAGRVGVRLSPNGVYNNMGSPDFREQFLAAAGGLNRFPLAYLHVMDGLGFGFHELGEPITLREFRGVFDRPLIGNVGYNQETAEAAIAAGDADLIAFGRPFISNPDLVTRFRDGIELAEPAPMSVWYSHGVEGYVDYPSASA